MRKLKKGFTLVELVIVIAVIAVLTAVLVPTFIHLTKKAKDASDKTVVKNANIQLAAQEATEGKNKSMHDAVLDVKEIGYHMPTVQTGNENKILWDRNNDRFVLVDKNDKVLHSDAGVAEGSKIEGDAKLDYFYAVDNLNNRGGYSAYALNKGVLDATGENVVVNITGFGFDAGDIGECDEETADDKKFTINVADSNKEILVATSSVSTNLYVNAPNGSVTHAGIAGEEDIVAIKPSSFHEQGRVGFIKMGTGNFVAESSAEIKALWFSNSEATYDKKSGAIVTEYADSEAIKAAVGLDSGTAVREEIIVGEDIDDVKDVAVKELDHEINPQPLVVEEISTWAELIVFTEKNATVSAKLMADISFELFPLEIKACKTLDLNGHSLYLQNGLYDETMDLDQGGLIYVPEGSSLTVDDSSGNNSGTIEYRNLNEGQYGNNSSGTMVFVNYGELIINGGTFPGAISVLDEIGPFYTVSHPVLLNFNHVVINGGTFTKRNALVGLLNYVFVNGFNYSFISQKNAARCPILELKGGTYTNEKTANNIVINYEHTILEKGKGTVLDANGDPYDSTTVYNNVLTNECARAGTYTIDPQEYVRGYSEHQDYTEENNFTIQIYDRVSSSKYIWTIVKTNDIYTLTFEDLIE